MSNSGDPGEGYLRPDALEKHGTPAPRHPGTPAPWRRLGGPVERRRGYSESPEGPLAFLHADGR